MAKTVFLEEKHLPAKILALCDGHIVSYDLTDGMIAGRSTASFKADIDLKLNFVSRRHGVFNKKDKSWFFTDTNSTNGTMINGVRMRHGEQYLVENGDVLQIFNGSQTDGNGFAVMVFVTDYPDKIDDKMITLDPSVAEINIGRTGNQDVLMGSNAVSANHASFFSAQKGWAIVDHNSMNGVYVNNMRIAEPKYLYPGDCVRIANIHFFFLGNSVLMETGGAEPKTNEEGNQISNGGDLNIHIVERSVWQRTKKLMLLQNIDMTIKAGEMVLILGGSGAGKTTFMNAVMGYEKANGTIKHGDTNVYEDYESMKYKIGFVPQQDLVRGSDTVYDTIHNAADMKLPTSMKKAERNERIELVLDKLGLKRERSRLVSKLSGGQRKRLSIAVEYIADPALFFLDEPDSGLDGIMAKTLMENLRTIADEGKIVMVISHGPDRAADLFDKVIVLAKSIKDNCGHLAFFGSVEEAYEFFDTISLEGIVKRINREDEGGDGLSDFYIEKYAERID